jgi:hypothetical protein
MTESKIVYIASPYAGDTGRNTAFAIEAFRRCIAEGNTPVAPHLLYTRILDDTNPAERETGLALGLNLLRNAHLIWVCGETISSGMRAEIAEAERLGMDIRYVSSEEIRYGLCPAMAGEQAPGREMRME